MDAPQRPTNQRPHGNATAQSSQDKPSRADACDDGMGGTERIAAGDQGALTGTARRAEDSPPRITSSHAARSG